jgi:monoterpene epsilon-lactone hydrolase
LSRAQLDALLAEFDSAADTTPFSVEKARRTWYAFTEDYEVPADVVLTQDAYPNTRLEWTTRRGLKPAKAVLFLHGGGYVCGSAHSHRVMACGIAQHFDGTVANLDYRLAPEHPFPAQLEDALFAFDSMIERGFAPESIGVAGDSAGGGLVLSLMLELKRRGRRLPGAGWCISAWLDLTQRLDRVSNPARDPIVFAEVLNTSSLIYLHGHSPHDALVSPLTADLESLPPLLIQVGSEELLLEDSVRLDTAARAAGVDVTFEEWPAMPHAWHLFARRLSEGGDATRRGAEWFDAKLSASA